MASLGNALVTKILGHSDAEKAFRPWWDNLEDFLVYGLVMLGLIVAPTAIINGTPLDCNFCQSDHCDGKFDNHTAPLSDPTVAADGAQVNPNFNAWWVKKYCTMTAVDQFILYFPYILLIMALVIVLIERVFIRIFKAGLKLDTFYNLLVKETLEATKTSGDGGQNTGQDAFFDLENTKTALEVSHSFSSSGSNYFFSYALRTVLELIVAAGLLVWLLILGVPSIQKEEFIYCDVHGYHYECAGHPQQFYMYVLIIVIVILGIYLFCCIYNVLWLAFPCMGALSRVMSSYKHELRKGAKAILTDREMLGELYQVYYKNRDLKLLLDLLAESSGIAPSIRIMSLFDSSFRSKLEPSNFSVATSAGDGRAKVEFDDAPTMRDVFAQIKEITCIYMVEILPATPSSTVATFKFGEGDQGPRVPTVNECGDTELQLLNCANPKRTEFRELDPTKEYTIRVSTVLNGRAIARRIEVIKPSAEVVPK